jgi:adenosylcobyric acid synthase
MDANGQVAGCYLHGIFDQEQAIQAIVNWCGFHIEQHVDLHVQQEQAIDKLADVCQQYLDLEKIETLIQQWERSNDD